jgi:transposase InsO family protein
VVRQTRSRPESRVRADSELLILIRELKSAHLFWGYRRIWANLKFVRKIRINQKRVYRLMRENDLLVKKNLLLKARCENQPSKPRPCRPNQWWGVDMTKVLTEAGWAYVVVVNDWFTKKILGSFVGSQSKAADWLEALNRAVCLQFPRGIREAKDLELSLMSDNGSQPTSLKFIEETAALGLRQAFTSYSNPKGNADTERVIRTIKEELLWLREWQTVQEIASAMPEFAADFNEHYLHSALGYKTPNEFEKQWFTENQKTLSARA